MVLAVTGTILFWKKTGPAVRTPLAGLSLLSGIAAVLVGLLISYIIGGLLGLAAVYLGNSERSQARALGVHWLAIGGIVLGGVAIVMYIAGRLIE